MALLKAVQNIFPVPTNWIHFDIDQLPYFDPSLQFENVPTPVIELRRQVIDSKFIVISTPEYAHGIPGILKNALEWLVCEESMKKNVIVFIATASGGNYVKKYLLETLKTMDLVVDFENTFVLKSARSEISKTGVITSDSLKSELDKFLKSCLGRLAN